MKDMITERIRKSFALCMACCAFVATAALIACGDDGPEAFDQPFVRIAAPNGASSQVVLTNARVVNAYTVYLSSRPVTDSLEVNYEIIVGDGLQEDVDYKVVTTQNPLIFLPGIYDAPIRIRWLKHEVDPTKDNTVTIRLTGNSKGYTLGFPGPDHLQTQVTIEKRNE
jgi:hypothetical protein